MAYWMVIFNFKKKNRQYNYMYYCLNCVCWCSGIHSICIYVPKPLAGMVLMYCRMQTQQTCLSSAHGRCKNRSTSENNGRTNKTFLYDHVWNSKKLSKMHLWSVKAWKVFELPGCVCAIIPWQWSKVSPGTQICTPCNGALKWNIHPELKI